MWPWQIVCAQNLFLELGKIVLGFHDGSGVKKKKKKKKNLPANIGHAGSIPGSGRSLGEGNDNLLQYPCMENPMDREAWRAP